MRLVICLISVFLLCFVNKLFAGNSAVQAAQKYFNKDSNLTWFIVGGGVLLVIFILYAIIFKIKSKK